MKLQRQQDGKYKAPSSGRQVLVKVDFAIEGSERHRQPKSVKNEEKLREKPSDYNAPTSKISYSDNGWRTRPNSKN